MYICTKVLEVLVYIMYNVYMDKEEYSVKDFRDNLRAALDRADNGNDVFIRRHDKRYFVCAEDYYKELLKSDRPVVHKVEMKDKDWVRPVPKERLANGVCKVHGTPLDDRGKCLMKGCKYS